MTRGGSGREYDARALIRAFAGVADRWGLTARERCALLGGIAPSTLRRWTGGRPPRALTVDQRDRVAYVFAIDLAAQQFYGGGAVADGYVRRLAPGAEGEGSALDYMLAHGLPGLVAVRAHLEALGGGPSILPPDQAEALLRNAGRRSARGRPG